MVSSIISLLSLPFFLIDPVHAIVQSAGQTTFTEVVQCIPTEREEEDIKGTHFNYSSKEIKDV